MAIKFLAKRVLVLEAELVDSPSAALTVFHNKEIPGSRSLFIMQLN